MELKHKQINSITKTMQYLQKLAQDEKHERLVLKFSEGIFKEDSNEALRIFSGNWSFIINTNTNNNMYHI